MEFEEDWEERREEAREIIAPWSFIVRKVCGQA